MATLREIEDNVAALSPEDLLAFRAWFEEFQEELWDRQIEADSLAGKLDAMAERALRNHAEGKTTPL